MCSATCDAESIPTDRALVGTDKALDRALMVLHKDSRLYSIFIDM